MQTFSEQPSGQTFPQKTACHMPMPFLVLKQAYLYTEACVSQC